ncbi:retrovirus-related pol polyprotein from transposon TNT 1-94 [Tanacetum coccineum]
MFTTKKIVHLKKTTPKSVEILKLEIKVYSRRPKQIKSVGSGKKVKIVKSKIANNSEPTHLWGSNATDVPSSSSLVNDRLSGLFSDFEVAFQKNTCFIRNLEGIDLLLGSRDTNLYTISLDDMLKTSLICLLSKASKIKSCLCIKKSKKSSHQPKTEDTNQEKLYLLHMDLYGPMHVKSINGKKYILVIVDDYSRFTWVKFLRSKDEAPDAIIKCIKNIQVCLNAIVRNVRIDNGTEFVNQTLCDFYENVGIYHQTYVARTPQQNGVVERRNQTLVEASRTMLIFSKSPLFLWAEAINIASNDSEDLGKLYAKADIVPVATAPRAVDIVDSHMSTFIDQDAPSSNIPSTQEQEHSLIISQGVEESPKSPLFHDDPLYEFLHEDSTSQESSANVRPSHTLFDLIGRWTKDHPLARL